MVIVDTEKELNTLRELREKECFPVINRGKLWYNCLSMEQLSELNDWYFAWLDVTDTKVIPSKLEWLNKKLSREEITW
jgi:hypothetical protein